MSKKLRSYQCLNSSVLITEKSWLSTQKEVFHDQVWTRSRKSLFDDQVSWRLFRLNACRLNVSSAWAMMSYRRRDVCDLSSVMTIENCTSIESIFAIIQTGSLLHALVHDATLISWTRCIFKIMQKWFTRSSRNRASSLSSIVILWDLLKNEISSDIDERKFFEVARSDIESCDTSLLFSSS